MWDEYSLRRDKRPWAIPEKAGEGIRLFVQQIFLELPRFRHCSTPGGSSHENSPALMEFMLGLKLGRECFPSPPPWGSPTGTPVRNARSQHGQIWLWPIRESFPSAKFGCFVSRTLSGYYFWFLYSSSTFVLDCLLVFSYKAVTPNY